MIIATEAQFWLISYKKTKNSLGHFKYLPAEVISFVSQK